MTPTEPELAAEAATARAAIQSQISQVYIGPEQVVDLMLIALLAPGHVLLEGVPGVAKTTLAKAFSDTLGCEFRRIQFTPDLVPADITGTYVFNLKANELVLRHGPVFTHVLLGDEINRAPAKTQSALLEAMAEGQVTLEGQTLPLPDPFIVLATQNPLEQEGVYPLPEAQVDRFLMKLEMGYPTPEDEQQMLATWNQRRPRPAQVLSPELILQLRAQAEQVYTSPELRAYIVALVGATRSQPERVHLGASPRASLALMRAAKARALLQGRVHVLPDDVRALAAPVLAHRLVLTHEAELDQDTGARVVTDALRAVQYRGPADGRAA